MLTQVTNAVGTKLKESMKHFNTIPVFSFSQPLHAQETEQEIWSKLFFQDLLEVLGHQKRLTGFGSVRICNQASYDLGGLLALALGNKQTC